MQDLTPTPPTPADGRRLTFGLLLSLTIHAMLLSLAFSGQGNGLPGFGLPWQDRRTEVPDLRVILLPTPLPAAQPLLSAGAEQPMQLVSAEPTAMTLVHFAPPPKVSAAASKSLAKPEQAKPEKVTEAKRVEASTSAPAIWPAIVPLPAGRPNEKRATPPQPAVDLIAVAKSNGSTWNVPTAPEVPAPVTAVAIPSLPDADYAKQDAQRQAELLDTERQEIAKQAAAQRDAARQETARIEAERQELARQTAARQAAEKQAATRQEAMRQEVARADAARVEAERQEAAKKAAAGQLAAIQEAARAETARAEAERKELSRQETARQEAARIAAERHEVEKQTAARHIAERQAAAQQEVNRQEVAQANAARVEAERKELSRQETARQAAAQQEAGRQEAARQAVIQIEATRLAALQAEAEKRQEKLRAIGRQLNEEAARRDAAAAQRQLPSASSARRGRLLGRTDPNAELILYAEAWSRKIQLNMTFDMVREAAKQPHTNPMVTVAIRSDGSVESVTFVTSSGVPAIDEAIRRIVYSQANYQAFPPGLVKEFDVIEIRRTWYFDMAIRLY
ncbi:MAG: TonB C-terminal domain-containing protein [Undibacterium sp.]|nr:TonB C-terminal domain-containing protein [Undibacterium sp.]